MLVRDALGEVVLRVHEHRGVYRRLFRTPVEGDRRRAAGLRDVGRPARVRLDAQVLELRRLGRRIQHPSSHPSRSFTAGGGAAPPEAAEASTSATAPHLLMHPPAWRAW